MQVVVPADRVTSIRRAPGVTVIITNTSGTDVYVSTDHGELASSLAGTVPTGTRVAATTGQLTIAVSGLGNIFMRAATLTTVEVLP